MIFFRISSYFRKNSLPPVFLLFIPLLTYVISYLYLAYYHGSITIMNTVIHESGSLTLLEDMFYVSHFLGHIPVHTVIGCYFIGCYLMLSGKTPPHPGTDKQTKLIIAAGLLFLFLAISFAASWHYFGSSDTMAYIRQQKQGVSIYEEGGSWNLHLPSTLLLFFFIPVYIAGAMAVFRHRIDPYRTGLGYMMLGITGFSLCTLFFNDDFTVAFKLWRNPRYLAHSVRELATFPLTYFPLPLFFLLRQKETTPTINKISKKNLYLILLPCLLIFLCAFSYQVYSSLAAGVGKLAQKPPFAKGGTLSIPYLLASHYFEHFLDTIYFTLLCYLLYCSSQFKKDGRNRPSSIQ